MAPASRASISFSTRPSWGRLSSVSRVSRSSSARSSQNPVPVSVERMALPRASVKLRPMDITSPTDFMWVVRVESAAGNFSKANRGTLTTT